MPAASWKETQVLETDINVLVQELVERCIRLLSANDWPRVYEALGEMHDQLMEDIPDFAVFCEVFPRFIERLIDGLGGGDVASLPQAQVYSNSASEKHRSQAGTWIKTHYQRKA